MRLHGGDELVARELCARNRRKGFREIGARRQRGSRETRAGIRFHVPTSVSARKAIDPELNRYVGLWLDGGYAGNLEMIVLRHVDGPVPRVVQNRRRLRGGVEGSPIHIDEKVDRIRRRIRGLGRARIENARLDECRAGLLVEPLGLTRRAYRGIDVVRWVGCRKQVCEWSDADLQAVQFRGGRETRASEHRHDWQNAEE